MARRIEGGISSIVKEVLVRNPTLTNPDGSAQEPYAAPFLARFARDIDAENKRSTMVTKQDRETTDDQ